MKSKEFECEPFLEWIDDIQLRCELRESILECKSHRKESQKEVSKQLGISLTKIKQIEKGTCKDFNAINNYINYLWKPFYL